ncbi:hypothetical protein AAMO2058_001514100 [Amorphochlora amoebiformis]
MKELLHVRPLKTLLLLEECSHGKSQHFHVKLQHFHGSVAGISDLEGAVKLHDMDAERLYEQVQKLEKELEVVRFSRICSRCQAGEF